MQQLKTQNSKLKTPNVLTSVIYILFVSAYFFYYANIVGDPDIAWHIKAGELIRELGTIPQTDPWAYTSNNEQWFNISWLFDVIISYINDFIGIGGLISIFAVSGAILVAITCNICIKRNANILAILLISLLTGILFTMGIIIRPQIITFISALIFYIILQKTNDAPSPTLFILPFIMLLWVNVHGGFLLGFLFLGAYGVDAILLKKWSRLKKLLIISAICALTLPINPLGLDLIPATLRTLNSAMSEYIVEWKPPVILKDILITIHFTIFLFAFNRNKKTSIGEYAICIGLLLLGLCQKRNYEIFVLISAPYIAINLSEFFAQFPKLIEKDEEFKRDFESSKGRITMFIIACIVTLFFCIPATRNIVIPDEKFGWQKKDIPFEAIAFIEKNYPDVMFYNRYRYGGYLIYFTKIPVFIDGRERTAYPQELIDDYITLIEMKYDWEKVLEKHNINGILLPNLDTRLVYFENSPKWKKAFEGNVATIYVKNEHYITDY